MSFRKVFGPVAATSLIFCSSVASAAGTLSAASPAGAAAATCGAAVAAAAAQAPRPGCVLPAIDAGVPVSTEAVAVQGQPFLGGLLFPLVGLAAFAAVILALSGESGDGEGSLSRG